jgi:hypothetical protein
MVVIFTAVNRHMKLRKAAFESIGRFQAPISVHLVEMCPHCSAVAVLQPDSAFDDC